MKAMILAAGLGTRLKPMTDHTPKALILLKQKPILEHLLNRLKRLDIEEVIINVHHFPEQILNFLQTNRYFGMHIEVSYEANLLDTGGGLKKAQWFFNDGKPFLLHNVDVLSDLDLKQMLKYHEQKNSLATLAVRTRTTSRYLLFNSKNHLIGSEDVNLGQKNIVVPFTGKIKSFSFMGIHIISPAIFTKLPPEPKFSIITAYLDLAAGNETICAFKADSFSWSDLGHRQNLQAAEEDELFILT
jgi:mannose-1-phosphate guanylyltransferase